MNLVLNVSIISFFPFRVSKSLKACWYKIVILIFCCSFFLAFFPHSHFSLTFPILIFSSFPQLNSHPSLFPNFCHSIPLSDFSSSCSRSFILLSLFLFPDCCLYFLHSCPSFFLSLHTPSSVTPCPSHTQSLISCLSYYTLHHMSYSLPPNIHSLILCLSLIPHVLFLPLSSHSVSYSV